MSNVENDTIGSVPRILLIEDDESQSHLLQHLLRRAKPGGFLSQTVETLSQGLAALRTGEFDVVIIDLGLPDSQGLESFDAVHQAFPTLPAVVMTGNDDEALAIEAVRRGAQDYIVKNYASGHTIVRSLRYAMERKRLEEELLHSQKMQAVGSLAGGIAHEFNNLLQVIQGYTRYAIEGLSPDEQRHKDLTQVAMAAERAAVLTSQLLEFGRPHELQRSEISIDALIDALANMLSPLMRDKIEIETQLRATSVAVPADANQLQQLLMNLCLNARDAMPEGGTLRIDTEQIVVKENSPDRNSFPSAGQYVKIGVTDTGCGMSAEVRDRVFEPFYTTKGPDAGCGLGLAVAYGIVQQHAGVITVESEIDQGTRFDVFLPVTPQDDQCDAPACTFAGVHDST